MGVGEDEEDEKRRLRNCPWAAGRWCLQKWDWLMQSLALPGLKSVKLGWGGHGCKLSMNWRGSVDQRPAAMMTSSERPSEV